MATTRERGSHRNRLSEPPSSTAPPPSDPGVLMSYWPPGRVDDVLHDAADVSHHAVVHAEDPLWETWFEDALDAGIDDELARLGRSLIREAFMLHWKDALREQAGWGDGGEAMLELALANPSLAAIRWRALLDGEQ